MRRHPNRRSRPVSQPDLFGELADQRPPGAYGAPAVQSGDQPGWNRVTIPAPDRPPRAAEPGKDREVIA